MVTINGIVDIDEDRRTLRLQEPLPKTLWPGQTNVVLVLSDESLLTPEEARERARIKNNNAWKEFLAELDHMDPLPGDDLPSDLNKKWRYVG